MSGKGVSAYERQRRQWLVNKGLACMWHPWRIPEKAAEAAGLPDDDAAMNLGKIKRSYSRSVGR